MGWKTVSVMSQRLEFVMLALQEVNNFSELCRRFGISRKTGYKFLNRYRCEGTTGLQDRSRRPKQSPNATNTEVEQLILELRNKHAAWGSRKLKRRLEDMGYHEIPSVSTVTAILRRNGRMSENESQKHKAWRRFEAERPNDLWQMDFKGHFPARNGRCHPLTVLDDHSRYSLCIAACKNERRETVMHHLTHIFRRYGMPNAMLMDNGSPWGNNSTYRHTRLTVWLMQLGIKSLHSRPLHPQTLGKDERFHRTMHKELIANCIDKSITQCQRFFEHWRSIYNTERPHQALNLEVPANCYQISKRTFPEKLPEVQYEPLDEIRKVHTAGIVKFKSRQFKISRAFKGQWVALRATSTDGHFDVFFCYQKIAEIDLI